MKKRIALLVYPDFSLQEVANLMYVFRWYFDTFTDVIYTELSPVRSEEGVLINPVKTCSEFCVNPSDGDVIFTFMGSHENSSSRTAQCH